MTHDRQQLALSRRRFLSGSLTLAGALAAGPLSRPAAVFAASGPGVAGAGTSAPDGPLTDVAEQAGRTVTVGRGADGAAAVWVRDAAGAPWFQAPAGPFAGAELAAAAVVDGRLLVAGAVPHGAFLAQPAWWHSSDGRAWRRGSATGQLAGGRIRALAAGDGRVLAAGCRLPDDGEEGAGPLLASSPDGRSWRLQPAAGLGVTGEGEVAALAFHDGRWYAAVVRMTGTGLWTSTDGETWSRAPATPAAPTPTVITALTSTRGRLVATGTGVLDLQPYLWTSSDGARSWDALAVPPQLQDRSVVLNGVAAAGGRDLVVAGRRHEQAVLARVEQELRR